VLGIAYKAACVERAAEKLERPSREAVRVGAERN
jgi:hypothetical protein